MLAAAHCKELGAARVALLGVSELAEIASLRLAECGLQIVGVVDKARSDEAFLGMLVVAEMNDVTDAEAFILTELTEPAVALLRYRSINPEKSIVVPSILGIH